MRLQKFLASVGLGSRRACEELITGGRIAVDGKKVTKLGTVVDPDLERITHDGIRVKMSKKVYLLVNKPVGTICSSRRDRTKRPLLIDLVERPGIRLFSVGRLDVDSKGAIILTNDGDFANIVAHPRYDIDKTYKVRIRGQIAEEQLGILRKGVWLAEGKATPTDVRIVQTTRKETILRITLKEGKNRIIRRVMAKAGFKVIELERTWIGPVALGNLKPGRSRNLNSTEVKKLMAAGAAAGRSAGRRKTSGKPSSPRRRKVQGQAPRSKAPGARKTGKKKPAVRRKGPAVKGGKRRQRRP